LYTTKPVYLHAIYPQYWQRKTPMPNANRNNCLLLLLIILVSHAALTIHVGTHVAVEKQSCQLCTQHVNLVHAVPPSVSLWFDLRQETPTAVSRPALVRHTEIHPYRQRAPPRIA
jgi:hypothetical protein